MDATKIESELSDIPPFLLALELIVRKETVLNLSGALSVGVEADKKTTWWCAEFGSSRRTWFSHSTVTELDAELVLSEHQAQAILETGSLPSDEPTPRVRGDLDLVDQFLARFETSRDFVSIRLK